MTFPYSVLSTPPCHLDVIRRGHVGGSLEGVSDIPQDVHRKEQVPTVVGAPGQELQQASDHLRHALTSQHPLTLGEVFPQLWGKRNVSGVGGGQL